MMVILRPLNKDSWSGIIKYKNCFEDIGSYYTRSGRRYTGLTPEDEEKYKDVVGAESLSPYSRFWDTFSIRTTGKDLYLDIDKIEDLFKYTFLKNHKRVANGLGNMKATANFVLINQEAEAKEANTFARLKRRAIIEFGKLTPNEMRQCLRLFGHNAESMDAEIVEQKLGDIVEGNPDKFLAMWVDNTTKDTEFLIKTAVSKNILRKNKTTYKYGTDVVGYTLEDAIAYLDNPLHNDIKLAIAREIDIK
jgi:hypothetical protein